jgi:hypothetical protein
MTDPDTAQAIALFEAFHKAIFAIPFDEYVSMAAYTEWSTAHKRLEFNRQREALRYYVRIWNKGLGA